MGVVHPPSEAGVFPERCAGRKGARAGRHASASPLRRSADSSAARRSDIAAHAARRRIQARSPSKCAVRSRGASRPTASARHTVPTGFAALPAPRPRDAAHRDDGPAGNDHPAIRPRRRIVAACGRSRAAAGRFLGEDSATYRRTVVSRSSRGRRTHSLPRPSARRPPRTPRARPGRGRSRPRTSRRAPSSRRGSCRGGGSCRRHARRIGGPRSRRARWGRSRRSVRSPPVPISMPPRTMTAPTGTSPSRAACAASSRARRIQCSSSCMAGSAPGVRVDAVRFRAVSRVGSRPRRSPAGAGSAPGVMSSIIPSEPARPPASHGRAPVHLPRELLGHTVTPIRSWPAACPRRRRPRGRPPRSR